MYHPTRTLFKIKLVIFLFAITIVNASEYSRLINPPMTITINGESMQLTGGLNRPEPQFLDWNNDCLLYTSDAADE